MSLLLAGFLVAHAMIHISYLRAIDAALLWTVLVAGWQPLGVGG